MMKHKFQVGQKLWFVPAMNTGRYRKMGEVVITKIGRKWLEIDGIDRVDIKMLFVDGGEYTSPGRCYLSQNDYQIKLDIGVAWMQFCESLFRERHRPPDGITIEGIKEAKFKLLQKTLDEKSE